MRGFFLLSEALLALAIALPLAALALTPRVSVAPLYAYQLLEDILEVCVKSRILRPALENWVVGEAGSEGVLRDQLAALLDALGSYCLELEAKQRISVGNCSKRLWVSSWRLIYVNGWQKLSARLGI